MSPIFAGSYVALPTPFEDSGAVDLDAFRSLIDLHAASGTSGIVVCGTTGEAVTLSERERNGLIDASVEYCAGRMKVVAGVGTNSTAATLVAARSATKAGVDGLLVVTPYYNKPSRLGLMRHFGAVADATSSPVMLYNVPSRTGVDLRPEWAIELGRQCHNVVAIKEASDDPERISVLCSSPDLEVLCGEDRRIAEFASRGAVGAVNVVGNVLPEQVAELVVAAAPGGDAVRAQELTAYLAPLVKALFIETNPVPVKAALAWLGRGGAGVREPLAPLEEQNRTALLDVLRNYGRALPSRALART